MHELAEWANFYIAGAGAAAALAGLSIVAISANLDAILKTTVLPTRAAATIATLVLALIVCMAGLMRGQSVEWYGAEVLVFAVIAWWTKVRSTLAMQRDPDRRPESLVWLELAAGQGQTVPFLIGGAGLLLGWSGALMWIGFGVLAVFGLSMISVWVLLVEIRR